MDIEEGLALLNEQRQCPMPVKTARLSAPQNALVETGPYTFPRSYLANEMTDLCPISRTFVRDNITAMWNGIEIDESVCFPEICMCAQQFRLCSSNRFLINKLYPFSKCSKRMWSGIALLTRHVYVDHLPLTLGATILDYIGRVPLLWVLYTYQIHTNLGKKLPCRAISIMNNNNKITHFGLGLYKKRDMSCSVLL
jgi:hypothetical protein